MPQITANENPKMQGTAIHWFRQDLRLSDNPSLCMAATHEAVIPIYILDDENAADRAMGSASRVWLHHSLDALNTSLNGNLSLFSGDSLSVFKHLLKSHDVTVIYWNRCYEPWRIERDAKIKALLQSMDIKAKSFNGSLLWEPWEINNKTGAPYKVFTPFYRKGCMAAKRPREPLLPPTDINYVSDTQNAVSLKSLNLLPTVPWHKTIEPHWKIGEIGARKRLHDFINQDLAGYKHGRNIPSNTAVSKLSPHLHFGEISPNEAWHHVTSLEMNDSIDSFCSELGWREFSYHLLYHIPTMPTQNIQSKFDRFPWVDDKAALKAWQTGQTGVPMVDAGMRELWQTGYMHNRARMTAASFLVKNLRIDWRLGERWFWDSLFDADLASNSASWQWVAGCGTDAAPYFRIFNPVTQGQKFDPDGSYIRKYIPEIAALPNKYLFSPWEAPAHILEEANLILGQNYPKNIVDLKLSRQISLDVFASL